MAGPPSDIPALKPCRELPICKDEAQPRCSPTRAAAFYLVNPKDGGHGWLGTAVALAGGRWIMPGDLFPERSDGADAVSTWIATLGTAREDAEKRHIQRALAMTGGAILPAAKALGISRTTLWEKMKRYGLADPDA